VARNVIKFYRLMAAECGMSDGSHGKQDPVCRQRQDRGPMDLVHNTKDKSIDEN